MLRRAMACRLFGLPHNNRSVVLAGVVLIVIWTFQIFRFPLTEPEIEWNELSRTNAYHPPPNPTIDAFDFSPVQSDAISRVCRATTWNPDLIFTCDNSFGGVGNVRNSVLHCVRYAISAGATLVVPRILLRNNSNISKIKSTTTTDLSYMFDKEHFVESLRLSCPSLRVYNTESDIPDVDLLERTELAPESIVEEEVPLTGLEHPEQWRENFDTWLRDNRTETSNAVIVALGRAYLQYPVYSDGEAFALQFGDILKVRPDVRRLATSVLREMAVRYNLKLNLTKPILPDAYFGVHLRTEKDAVEAWSLVWIYGRYVTQSAHYLAQAPRSHTSVIYVASGDKREVARFTRDAKKIDMAVTTKLALLKGEEKKELSKLAWDQQALVDFLILMKGTDFAGIGHSSFSWNIALKREIFAHQRETFELEDWQDGDDLLVNGTVLLRDEYSQIYGIKRPEYQACLWP